MRYFSESLEEVSADILDKYLSNILKNRRHMNKQRYLDEFFERLRSWYKFDKLEREKRELRKILEFVDDFLLKIPQTPTH